MAFMNILIISFDADPPYMGGTATVANVLAKGFTSKGHFCALGYIYNSEHPSVFFKNKIKLSEDNREKAHIFFEEYKFDIILDQISIITNFKFLMSMPLGNCKIISAYHNRPMFHPPLLENFLQIYNESNNFLYKIYTLAKIPLLPIYKIKSKKRELKRLKDLCIYSDKIILLSWRVQ